MELHDQPTAGTSQGDEPFEAPRCGLAELAPPEATDAVIEAYKRDVDRTLLIENLKLSPAQRAEQLQDFMRFLGEIRQAGCRLRGEEP
jgi:hypothetical protein